MLDKIKVSAQISDKNFVPFFYIPPHNLGSRVVVSFSLILQSLLDEVEGGGKNDL